MNVKTYTECPKKVTEFQISTLEILSLKISSDIIGNLEHVSGESKKERCLIKRKMYNKRGIFKNETSLDCQ